MSDHEIPAYFLKTVRTAPSMPIAHGVCVCVCPTDSGVQGERITHLYFYKDNSTAFS